jgi:hypothetical protein
MAALRCSHKLKLGLFALLSLMDLGMTWLLLEGSNGHVFEGNPIAAWWLAELGWAGLVAFKLGLVVLIAGLVWTITARCPRAAGHFLTFACAAVAVVLIHSSVLAAQSAHWPGDTTLAHEMERSRQLKRQLTASHSFQLLRHQLIEQMVADRRTLKDALSELTRSQRCAALVWQLELIESGRSFRECLAINLIADALEMVAAQPERATRLSARLKAEFIDLFGADKLDLEGRVRPVGQVSALAYSSR